METALLYIFSTIYIKAEEQQENAFYQSSAVDCTNRTISRILDEVFDQRIEQWTQFTRIVDAIASHAIASRALSSSPLT